MDAIATNLVALAMLKATLGGILQDNGKPVPEHFSDYPAAIQQAGKFYNRYATTVIEGETITRNMVNAESAKNSGEVTRLLKSNKFYLPDATNIASGCFADHSELLEVIAPNVTIVGDGAFRDCRKLKTLVLGDVTSLGQSAFYGCHGLTNEISITTVTSIPDYAFFKCRSLRSVHMSTNLTSIGTSAFEGCRALVNTNFYPNVTRVGSKAFKNCSSLRGFPVKLDPLGNNIRVEAAAFEKCLISEFPRHNDTIQVANLYGSGIFKDAIILGSMVLEGKSTSSKPEAIPNGTFKNVRSTTSVTIYCDEFSRIGDEAFRGCQFVGDIYDFDTYISGVIFGTSTFRGCQNLTTVASENVSSIGDWCFSGCPRLDTITLNNATSVGFAAFCNCTNLVDLQLDACVDFGTKHLQDSYWTSEYEGLSSIGGPFSPNAGYPHDEFLKNGKPGEYAGPPGKIPLETLSLPSVQRIGGNCFGDAVDYQFTNITNLYLQNLTTAQIKSMDTYPYWYLHPSCVIHAKDGNFLYGE